MIDITELFTEEEITEVKERVKEEAIKDIADYIRQITVGEIKDKVKEELSKIDLKQVVKDTVNDTVNVNAIHIALHETTKLVKEKITGQVESIINDCFNFSEENK